MKENELAHLIKEYLSVKRYFFWRNNTGAFVGEYKGKKRFVKYGAVGSPDFFLVHEGTLYGIEAKAPKGKQSESQIEFEKNLVANGGVYILAHDLDDVMKVL